MTDEQGTTYPVEAAQSTVPAQTPSEPETGGGNTPDTHPENPTGTPDTPSEQADRQQGDNADGE